MSEENLNRQISRRDREPLPQLVGVFADDEEGFAEVNTTHFTGIPSFSPIIIETLDVVDFGRQLNMIQPEQVAMVITDQFWNRRYHRVSMANFLLRVRQQNPDAWIVETGGIAQDPAFKQSDRVLPRYELWIGLRNLQTVPPVANARIEALKIWTTNAFIRANEAAQIDVSGTDGINIMLASWDRAQKDRYYQQTLELLGMTEGEFRKQFLEVSRGSIPDVMHTLWTIMGHLELKHEKPTYGLSLQRLQELLKERENAQ